MQSILMYQSLVKILKNCGAYNIVCYIYTYNYVTKPKQVHVMPMQYILLCKVASDMLNKNTLGVKKVRGQSEAAL